MDQKENKQTTPVPTSSPQPQTPPAQKLSSEESYSKDYELISKKPNNTVLYIVLGIVLFLIISAIGGLYFFGILRF